MKTLTLLIAIVSLSLASLANAHSYRVFYLLRENGVVHGDHERDGVIPAAHFSESDCDRLHPYHYTANAPSEAAARRELLREVPNAVCIEIGADWD